MNSHPSFPRLLALAASVVALSASAQADVSFEQSFDGLNTGALVGQGGWTAFSNATVYNVVSGGLSYTSGDISFTAGTRMLEVTGAGGAGINNIIYVPAGSYTGADVYWSFLARVNNATVGTGLTSSDGDDWRLTFTSTATTNKLSPNNTPWAGFEYASSNRYQSRISTATENSQVSSGAQNLDEQVYLIVGRLGWNGALGGYDSSTIWVNPDSSVGPSGTIAASSIGATAIPEVNDLAIRAFSTFESADILHLDQIRIGTDWTSVTTAIPEPSSFAALAGLGALGLGALRRRRRAPALGRVAFFFSPSAYPHP